MSFFKLYRKLLLFFFIASYIERRYGLWKGFMDCMFAKNIYVIYMLNMLNSSLKVGAPNVGKSLYLISIFIYIFWKLIVFLVFKYGVSWIYCVKENKFCSCNRCFWTFCKAIWIVLNAIHEACIHLAAPFAFVCMFTWKCCLFANILLLKILFVVYHR